MSAFRQLRTAKVIVLVAGALGAYSSMSGTPAKTPAELARALAQATHAVVLPEDIHWEPEGSVLHDMVVGRNVVFLGAASPGAPRDVYRARVRVTYEGIAYAIASTRNLTQTGLGDDHALAVSGPYAAFATYAFGQEQSVTLLDLRGEGSRNATTLPHDRLMAYLTNVQQTGDGAGVGRADITFDEPASMLWVNFAPASASASAPASEPKLNITVSHAGKVVPYSIIADTGLATGEGIHVEPMRHLPKRLVFWAVDTVRAVPWIGPAPIAWLEEKTFALKDTVKKFAYNATRKKDDIVVDVEAPIPPLDTSEASQDTGHWPPAPLKSMWKNPEPQEGEWVEPEEPWLKRLPALLGETPPAPFLRTFVRPDEARQYAKVLLVAMDTRQLDMDMEAGVEDPKPLAGPAGSGRVPRDPKIFTRIAATFNGGFKTEHGNYGMMVKRRVLLPPVAGAASVIVLKDGTIGLGSWGNTTKVSGVKNVQDANILSFRQNLEALVDDGIVNPSGRSLWGFTLPDTGMQTERSGICVTQAGHLLYAWGDDVSAITLGKAMKMAGCTYGIHLDMNPHHTGLAFTNITDIKTKNYKAQLLSKQMEIAPDRYIEYAPKDFFYMMLRDPGPQATEGLAWAPDTGTQPAPRFMPALWRAKSAEVELLSVEPSRASFRLRAGTAESAAVGPQLSELAAAERNRVLCAVTLGKVPMQNQLGLIIDGEMVSAHARSGQTRTLVTAPDGTLSIGAAPTPVEGAGAAAAATLPKSDVIELPSLIEAGVAVHTGASAEFALGITAEGRAIVARLRGGGAAQQAAALLKAGVKEAVLLTRSATAPAAGELLRSGTALQPSLHYRETSLSIVGYPMKPRAFRFDPEVPVELKKKH